MLRRSSRSQVLEESNKSQQRQQQQPLRKKPSKVIEVKTPSKFKRGESVARIKGSSDEDDIENTDDVDKTDDDEKGNVNITPPLRKSRRIASTPRSNFKDIINNGSGHIATSASGKKTNTPKSIHKRNTPVSVAQKSTPMSTKKRSTPASTKKKDTPLKRGTPQSVDRNQARARMTLDAEGDEFSSSDDSNEDDEVHSDYSQDNGQNINENDDDDDDNIQLNTDDESEEENDQMDVDDDYDDDYRSHRLKRSSSKISGTPRKRSRYLTHPTPQAKRNLQQRRAAQSIQRLPIPVIENLNKDSGNDVVSLSRTLLHVGATPGYLPCREDEYLMIEGCIESLLEDEQGGCVYISGTPGTGKTATVHSVIRGLIERSKKDEIKDFNYCEINGLRVSEPSRAYPIFWEALTKDTMNLSPKAALKALENYFNKGDNNKACILLMDELDQMVTNKQSEIYNFFNWPNLPNSKLIVVAVANTMDLPERVLRGKISSRLGMERINFAPYNRVQLIEIVQSRLRFAVSISGNKSYENVVDEDTRGIFDEDAVKIAAAKTASVQGDARRMLEICRQTLERVSDLPVKTSNVQSTLKAMTSSPLYKMMENLSFQAKVMLICTLRCANHSGLGTGECKFGDVVNLHTKLCQQLLEYVPLISLSKTDQYCILSQLASTRIILAHEPGSTTNAGLNRGSDNERMLILNVPESDVRKALGEDIRFQSLLSV